MARPRKIGLDYFPFDVEFFSDKKIKIVKSRYGNDGITIFIYLLCEIYKNGFFIVWDDDYKFIVADDLNVSDGLIEQVLKFLVERSLLKSILFNSDTIITSPSIQKRFQEIVKLRKTQVFVPAELWVLPDENTQGCIKVTEKQVFSEINPNKSENNTSFSEINSTKESKEKKSKVKKSKVKNIVSTKVDTRIALDYESIINYFNDICTSLPKVQKLSDTRKKQINTADNILQPMTFVELFAIVEKSDFLSGRNGKWLGCSFDWILQPSNIAKIIEGNYNNKQSQNKSSSYDIDELEKIDTLDDYDFKEI